MFGIGAIIKALVYLLIVVVIAGGLWYLINLKADLATSEANNVKLQDAMLAQNQLIESMQKDITQVQETNKALQEQNQKQKEDVDALSKKFEKRDFGIFASEQSTKAETLINRGTKNAIRCLELASGAPLNQNELSAKTPIEANRECPSLIDPSYKPIMP